MLSNRFQCIGINPTSGEVFFGADKGLASFRSDATISSSNFDSVKIFPNPVTAQFNGFVAIERLSTDSMIKITDVETGINLVFSTSADGSDKNVGQIAIVE